MVPIDNELGIIKVSFLGKNDDQFGDRSPKQVVVRVSPGSLGRVRFLLRAIVVLLGLLSLMAGMANRISPEHFWWTELLALAWPTLYISSAIVLILCLAWWRPMHWWLLPGIIVGAVHVPAHIQWGSIGSDELMGSSSRVMSYNVRFFNHHAWGGDPKDGRRMITLIADERPDVLCLQEMASMIGPSFTNLDSLRKVFDLPFVHLEIVDTVRHRYLQGIATFSRYPILATGQVTMPDTLYDRCIHTDLLIGSDTVRVYNVHLRSHRTRHVYDRSYEGSRIPGEAQLRKVLARIRHSVPMRVQQAQALQRHMADSPYPVVLCGDLNDPPTSFTYRTVRGELNDAFVGSGHGLGRTYNGDAPVRIDYMLHDPDLRSAGFRTLRHALSDHYPIVCSIQMPGMAIALEPREQGQEQGQ